VIEQELASVEHDVVREAIVDVDVITRLPRHSPTEYQSREILLGTCSLLFIELHLLGPGIPRLIGRSKQGETLHQIDRRHELASLQQMEERRMLRARAEEVDDGDRQRIYVRY